MLPPLFIFILGMREKDIAVAECVQMQQILRAVTLRARSPPCESTNQGLDCVSLCLDLPGTVPPV